MFGWKFNNWCKQKIQNKVKEVQIKNKKSIKNLAVERGIEESEMIRIIEEAKQQECIRCESGNKDVITSTCDQCGLEKNSKHGMH